MSLRRHWREFISWVLIECANSYVFCEFNQKWEDTGWGPCSSTPQTCFRRNGLRGGSDPFRSSGIKSKPQSVLRYWLDAEGKRVYTVKKLDPEGIPTFPAQPARFSPHDSYSRHRVTLKMRHGILDPVKAQLETMDLYTRLGSDPDLMSNEVLTEQQMRFLKAVREQRTAAGCCAADDKMKEDLLGPDGRFIESELRRSGWFSPEPAAAAAAATAAAAADAGEAADAAETPAAPPPNKPSAAANTETEGGGEGEEGGADAAVKRKRRKRAEDQQL